MKFSGPFCTQRILWLVSRFFGHLAIPHRNSLSSPADVDGVFCPRYVTFVYFCPVLLY